MSVFPNAKRYDVLVISRISNLNLQNLKKKAKDGLIDFMGTLFSYHQLCTDVKIPLDIAVVNDPRSKSNLSLKILNNPNHEKSLL